MTLSKEVVLKKKRLAQKFTHYAGAGLAWVQWEHPPFFEKVPLNLQICKIYTQKLSKQIFDIDLHPQL